MFLYTVFDELGAVFAVWAVSVYFLAYSIEVERGWELGRVGRLLRRKGWWEKVECVDAGLIS